MGVFPCIYNDSDNNINVCMGAKQQASQYTITGEL
jgi:hypothetical protein